MRLTGLIWSLAKVEGKGALLMVVMLGVCVWIDGDVGATRGMSDGRTEVMDRGVEKCNLCGRGEEGEEKGG